MHKTIFSRFLWLGDARVFTVGLGVLLAVMLGFAATTTATPAAAQNASDLPNVVNLAQEPDQVLEHRVTPNNDISDSQPYYRVPVETRWWEDARKVFQTWSRGNCATQPQVRIERQTGLQPFQLAFQGALLDQPKTEYLDSNRVHRYRLAVECQSNNGTPRMGSMLGAPFWIDIVENNQQSEPNLSLGYFGNWRTTARGFPSGGSTAEAREDGAAALLRYEGIAAAWVTTLDDSSTLARVVCDDQRDPQGNFIPCAEVDTEDLTPGISDRNQQVAWSNKWNQKSTENGHTVRVISDETHDVDVDALLVVHRW